MYSHGRGSRTGVLIILLIVGAVIGSAVGQALTEILPVLSESVDFGMSPSTFDIAGVLTFTFGLSLKINLATILGIALALLIYRRL